jgi:predicted transcriptional regulator
LCGSSRNNHRDQRAALDEGIAQAERGQVLPGEEVFDRLAERFGFPAG